jgi:2-phospho-L-lactate guanylyltransferase
MSTWGIIPVKHLREAKSSLSSRLTPEGRRQLVLAMLADVLNATGRAPSLLCTTVVSPDEEVLASARAHGAVGIFEPGLGLNGALGLAVEHVKSSGATSVLILPGDLPLLRPADVENIVTMASARRDAVIAPSKENGTNALFLRPPTLIAPKFGGESFPLHGREAFRAGVKPHIYRSPTIAFDVDKPEDLTHVRTLGVGTQTHKFLSELEKH